MSKSVKYPGRPKSSEKHATILATAKQLFITRGYELTSMDAVAQAAGVSKLTVYSHFEDKDSLFREIFRLIGQQYMPHTLFSGCYEGTIELQLISMARAYYSCITEPEAIAIYRLAVADARTQNKLSNVFYQTGPKRVLSELATFLRTSMDLGHLSVSDADQAAAYFLALTRGEWFNALLLGVDEVPTQSQLEQHFIQITKMFLQTYAAVKK